MKKNLLYVLSMIAGLLLASCSDDLLSEYNENYVTTKVRVLNQQEASRIGINLTESFKASPLRSNESLYPDYYGGAYIDENNNFVILICGDTTQYKKNFEQRTRSDHFLTKSSKYSWNDLNETMALLNEFMFNESNCTIIEEVGLTSFGIIAKENSIFINLKDCSKEKIKKFKQQVLDSPMLVFQTSSGDIIAHSSTVSPGQMSKASGTGSFGYRARRYGADGIVGSGHVIRSYAERVDSSEGIVGTCVETMMGGSVDAAFVLTNSDCQPTNYTFWNDIKISSYVETPYQGAYITLEGKNHHALQQGKIAATNVTAKIWIPSISKSITLWGINRATYQSQDGDSGGLIYSGNLNIFGIHEGGDDNYSYFISASEINRTMNLVTY